MKAFREALERRAAIEGRQLRLLHQVGRYLVRERCGERIPAGGWTIWRPPCGSGLMRCDDAGDDSSDFRYDVQPELHVSCLGGGKLRSHA